MRTHNQAEIKKRCHAVIPALVRKHDLGVVKKIEMDTEGWVNPCFFLNDEYVLRFNARDPHLPKYQREKFVFDLLLTRNFPVSQKVILDSDKDVIEYDILISKKVAGQNLEKDWSGLPKYDKAALTYKAGQLLRKLHSIDFNFYGELGGDSPLPRSNTWSEFLLCKVSFLLDEARKIELFSNEIENRIFNIMKTNEKLFAEVKSSKLVHVDYHFGNLIYSEKEINAVVDFEWAIAGDPLYDLMFWLRGDETFPESQERFFEGYGKSSFSKQENELIRLYQIIKNIELSIVAALHFPHEEAKDYLNTTLRSL